ncbi:MAG: hypothetical protein U1F33_07695 [Alphaproteobacteria bacterium]
MIRRLSWLSMVAALLVPTGIAAQAHGSWTASPGVPAILLGDGYPTAFYRVCFAQGTAIKIRYVLENEKLKEIEIKAPGNCIDLKAKKIDIVVTGADGAAASGTYQHLPQR